MNQHYFDTLSIEIDTAAKKRIKNLAEAAEMNFHYGRGVVQITLDETTSEEDLLAIVQVLAKAKRKKHKTVLRTGKAAKFPTTLLRKSEYLSHPVF